MNDRPLIVTNHAIQAYRRRMRDERKDHVLEQEIRECVAAALEAGLVYDRRPPGFVLYRRKSDKLPPRQRFVQCDRDSNFGFIIKRTKEEGDIVMTTLTKAGVRR